MMILVPEELADLSTLVRTLNNMHLENIALEEFDVFDSTGDRIGKITTEYGDYRLTINEEDN